MQGGAGARRAHDPGVGCDRHRKGKRQDHRPVPLHATGFVSLGQLRKPDARNPPTQVLACLSAGRTIPMPNHKWTATDLPDLSGKTIVVTGANSGIGFEAGREFARQRAAVVLACRSMDKANAAIAQIRSTYPGAAVEAMELDLASLNSVRVFAEAFRRNHDRLHILCNNAGVMAIPYRRTAEGFEMQMGTNHFGHFALTGLLFDRLSAADAA